MSLAELEDSLLRNLFQGYQKWVRPVRHANDTITVRFGLKISQLVDVVRTQNMRLRLHWYKALVQKSCFINMKNELGLLYSSCVSTEVKTVDKIMFTWKQLTN